MELCSQTIMKQIKKRVIMKTNEKEMKRLKDQNEETDNDSQINGPPVLEEIVIEELAVDGICGIY